VIDIFNHVLRSLNKIRSSIFAHNPKQFTHGQDGNFVFPIEFSQLKSSLSTYLDTIFKDSTYYESFFLRGVYFCGRTLSPERGLDVAPLSLPAALGKKQEPLSREWRQKVIFLRDLFEKKIFKEAALGQPIRRLLVSTNRLLNSAKVIAACIAVFWAVGIWAAHNYLSQGVRTMMPALSQIDASLIGLKNFTQGADDSKRQNYLVEQSDKILARFSGIHTVNMSSFFLPISWMSKTDQHILECVAKAYDSIIFPSLYSGLMKKVGEVVTVTPARHSSEQQAQGVLNPLRLSSFNL
jgi:type VI secretion system protein ImpL